MDENDVMVPGTDATDPHSCRMMSTMVADPRFAVRYTPRDRSYAIEERGDHAPGDLRVVQRIDFCPWCGERLPTDLSEQWWDAVDRVTGGAYELGDPLTSLPEQYRTDAWWRGRIDDEGNLVAEPEP